MVVTAIDAIVFTKIAFAPTAGGYGLKCIRWPGKFTLSNQIIYRPSSTISEGQHYI